MRPFAYHLPTSPAEARARIGDGRRARYLGAGTNLVDLMKREVETPDELVDVTTITSSEIIALDDGGLRIGAAARNTDVAADPLVRAAYPVLAQAIVAGASPQIRNVATTAGNLLQRTRCAYFTQLHTRCNKREPGTGCAARDGHNRDHAILGASEHCVATHPSDMAVALAALSARVIVEGVDGTRSIDIQELHRLPGDDPTRDTTLDPGDLITAVELPPPPAHARTRYRKVRDRTSFAFALVSVGARLCVADGRVTDVAIALGGVSHVPWRARIAEAAIVGRAPSHHVFEEAMACELERARPLAGNAFKVPLALRTAVSVLSGLADEMNGTSA